MKYVEVRPISLRKLLLSDKFYVAVFLIGMAFLRLYRDAHSRDMSGIWKSGLVYFKRFYTVKCPVDLERGFLVLGCLSNGLKIIGRAVNSITQCGPLTNWSVGRELLSRTLAHTSLSSLKRLAISPSSIFFSLKYK